MNVFSRILNSLAMLMVAGIFCVCSSGIGVRFIRRNWFDACVGVTSVVKSLSIQSLSCGVLDVYPIVQPRG